MDVRAVLAAYDERVRRDLRPPAPGWLVEEVDRVVRVTAPAQSPAGGMVIWSGLDEDSADAAIRTQIEHFSRSGRRFEWKLYGHDRPGDLADRLTAAGLEPEEEEALLVAPTGAIVAASAGASASAEVTVRHARAPADFAGISDLERAVYGQDRSWLVDELVAEQAADPDAISVHVAEAAGPDGPQVVCAAWARFGGDTGFAGLWGGSTHPDWRRRGIYRTLVARRAAEAQARDVPYLQVDASPDSRPILERLGFTLLTTTTPYVWARAGAA